MTEMILRCQKISKRYRIRPTSGMGWRRNQRVLVDDIAQFTNIFRKPDDRNQKVSFWALRDVSFEAYPGDILGIIGSNGAGKSTLLKILSKVTEPTSGRAVIKGRIGSLLEVGTGFHSELTGRENIFISGSIIGMSRAEIKKKFDEIVAFSGVEKFLDTPVKRFSSGMEVRLAFSVAAHLNPELLLVDEVLSVGDANFQQKSITKIQEVSQNGGAILFVSHNMTTIAALCNKAIVLDHGDVTYGIGNVSGAIDHYINSTKYNQPIEQSENRIIQKSKQVIIHSFDITDSNGFSVDTLTSGMPAKFHIDYTFNPPLDLEEVGFILLIKTLNGEIIADLSSLRNRGNPLIKSYEGGIYCCVDSFPVAPGTITITLVVEHKGEVLDMIENISVIEINRGGYLMENSKRDYKGWVDIENDWNTR